MQPLSYLASYATFIAVFISLIGHGLQTYIALIWAFFVIPLVELFLKPDTHNFNVEETIERNQNKIFDYFVWGIPFFQYIMWYIFLNRITEVMPLVDRIGLIFSFGVSCAVYGINVGHELGHRNTWYEKLMAKSLLLSTMYLHFFYEHNFGHHKKVSTPEDANSSRYNEILYLFLVRSISRGYVSAWKIQLAQLRQANKSFFSLKNEMLIFQIIQLGTFAIIYYFYGEMALICYFFSGLIGILVLESVNYIQHYGLVRAKKENGEYEKTTIAHSWNADYPLGRAVLFELSRHSDHHYRTNKKYQTLNSYPESPQMPTGYPGMMILAMIPPLWFAVMNKRLADYKVKNSAP